MTGIECFFKVPVFRGICSCFVLRMICIFVFLTSPVSYGELVWEQKVIDLNVRPLQVEAQVEFGFENKGAHPVEIRSVRTTCSCLQATVSTNHIAANESGGITATFNFRQKTGSQRKGIIVQTSDSGMVRLYIQATIPKVYSVSSERLEWRVGEKGDMKTCRLVNELDEPVRLISATSSSGLFPVQLETIRDGFEYEVRVFPEESFKASRAEIIIQTECPDDLPESRTYRIVAVLR